MTLKCKICGYEHELNLIDHIESCHGDIAMKDKEFDTLESYLFRFNADVDDVVKGLTLREELNRSLGLNIPDHSDLDFMKPRIGADGKKEELLWYDIVYQDEELMERFLVQMADHQAPHSTFRKYAKEMFGEDYWIKVNELSKAHTCLLPYREGDDGGGWEEAAFEPELEDIKHVFDPGYVEIVERVRRETLGKQDGGDASMLFDAKDRAYEIKQDVVACLRNFNVPSLQLRSFNAMFGDEWEAKVKEVIEGDSELEELLDKLKKNLTTLK